MPDFGASIIIELHETEGNNSKLNWDESNYIRMRYMNETSTDNYLEFKSYLLKVTNLNENCTVKEFLSSFAGLLITEKQWNNECEEKVENEGKYFKLIFNFNY